MFWVFTPCSQLCMLLHFGGMYCVHKKDSVKADGGSLSPIPWKKERKKERKLQHSLRTQLSPPPEATLPYCNTSDHINKLYLWSPSTCHCVYILKMLRPCKERFSQVSTPVGSGGILFALRPSAAVITQTPSHHPIHPTHFYPVLLQHPLEPIQSPWRWRQYVPLKCQNIKPQHSANTQKTTVIWSATAVKTW
jgi:hypothetical protein